LRATFKTGTGYIISLILGVISNKVMAVITGPIGIGLYSMLQQIQTTASTAGSIGGGGTSLTQGVASKRAEARDEFIRTVFWLFAIGSLLVTISLIILAPWIASASLGKSDDESIGLVRWVALPVVLNIFLMYLNGVLNGFREIGRLAVLQVVGAAVNAILSYPISIMVHTGYPIAFIGIMSASVSVQLVFAFAKIHAHGYMRPLWSRGFRANIEKASASSFFKMAGTLLITGVFGTIVLLIIRSLIVQYNGLADAGIFNVAWVICVMYPTVALTSLGTYFFPTLSQLEDPQKRINLMKDVFRLTNLIITPMLVALIVLKPLVIDILYSGQFYASLDILRWMLIGVYLSAASWVVAMPVLSFPNMRVYFWVTNLWYVGLLIFSVIAIMLLKSMEFIGLGFTILYALHLAFYIHFVHVRHGFSLTKRLKTSWFLGLFLVIVASGSTWTDTQVNWLIVIFWSMVTALFILSSFSRVERRQLLQIIAHSNR